MYSKFILLVLSFVIIGAVASRNVGEWNFVGKPTSDEVIPISVGLKIRNADWLKVSFFF